MNQLNIFNIFFFLALAFVLPALAAGQEIVTDRPDQTEASSVIPKHSFQIEMGAQIGEAKFEQDQSRYVLLPTVLLRYALFSWLEMRLVNQYLTSSSPFNSATPFMFSDVELGAKIQILQNENINTEIAFISHLVIPTAKTEITNGSLGTVNKLSVAHDISKNCSIGYNLGYNNFGIGKGVATYSLAIGLKLTQKLGFYIEAFGEFLEFETHVANLDGGFTFLLKENFQLDASAGMGLNYEMYYISLGASWNIAIKK